MKRAVVATFNDRDHAEPVLKRLNESGLHAEVRDESRWQKAHLSDRLASVKVDVPDGEFDTARQRLREWQANEGLMEQAVCCPECGSPDVDYPQVTRKFVLPSLHTVFFKLGFIEKEFYCNTCQATWPLRAKLESERDVLNWPIKKSRLHENPEMTP